MDQRGCTLKGGEVTTVLRVTSPWNVIWACAALIKKIRSRPSFFQGSFISRDYHFKLFSSSKDPLLLKKENAFFNTISALETHISKQFVLEAPVPGQKINARDPTVENLVDSYLSQNFLSTLWEQKINTKRKRSDPINT